MTLFQNFWEQLEKVQVKFHAVWNWNSTIIYTINDSRVAMIYPLSEFEQILQSARKRYLNIFIPYYNIKSKERNLKVGKKVEKEKE